MKRIALVLAALALVALGYGAAASAEPLNLKIDRAHSEVGFDVRHFFNKVHGKFTDFSGTVMYDPKNLAASTVEVTIRDTSVFTANDRRDNHLRTDAFFYVEKFPTITFKSTSVVPGKDANHFQIVGDLTIRDVTKSVTLETEFLGMGPFSIGGNSLGIQAGFLGKTTIPDRKEYGVSWNKALDQGGMMLSDDVDITLNIAAFGEDPNAKAPPAKK